MVILGSYTGVKKAVQQLFAVKVPSTKYDKWTRDRKDKLAMEYEEAMEKIQAQFLEVMVSKGGKVKREVANERHQESAVGAFLREPFSHDYPAGAYEYPTPGDYVHIMDKEKDEEQGEVNYFTITQFGKRDTKFMKRIWARDTVVADAWARTEERDMVALFSDDSDAEIEKVPSPIEKKAMKKVPQKKKVGMKAKGKPFKKLLKIKKGKKIAMKAMK